jgi:hypothetical protein
MINGSNGTSALLNLISCPVARLERARVLEKQHLQFHVLVPIFSPESLTNEKKAERERGDLHPSAHELSLTKMVDDPKKQ